MLYDIERKSFKHDFNYTQNNFNYFFNHVGKNLIYLNDNYCYFNYSRLNNRPKILDLSSPGKKFREISVYLLTRVREPVRPDSSPIPVSAVLIFPSLKRCTLKKFRISKPIFSPCFRHDLKPRLETGMRERGQPRYFYNPVLCRPRAKHGRACRCSFLRACIAEDKKEEREGEGKKERNRVGYRVTDL